jgi:hypothetical protein
MPSLSKVKKSLVARAKGSASAVAVNTPSADDEDLQPDLPVSSTAAAAAAHEDMMVIATVVDDATSPTTHAHEHEDDEEKKPSATTNKRKESPPSSTSDEVDGGSTADAAVTVEGPPNKKPSVSYMQEPVIKPSYVPQPIICHTNISDEYHKLSSGDGTTTSSSWGYPMAPLMPNPPLNPTNNRGGGHDEVNKFRSHLIENIAASARNMEFMTPHQAYGILGGSGGGGNIMQGYVHVANNAYDMTTMQQKERTTQEAETVVKRKESDDTTDATTLQSEKEQKQKQGNKKATKPKKESSAAKEAIESWHKDNGDAP